MSNDIHELSDAEIMRQAQRIEFEKYFPEYERVARGEAIILKKGDSCIKLYQEEYTEEVIKKYARVTNHLADKLTGKRQVIDMPSGGELELVLIIIPVDKVDKISDGRNYAECKFAEGQSLQKLHQKLQLSDTDFGDAFLDELKRSDMELIEEICSKLEKTLKEQVSESDHDAIKIHPDNFKITKDGNQYYLTVTDISCALRIINK